MRFAEKFLTFFFASMILDAEDIQNGMDVLCHSQRTALFSFFHCQETTISFHKGQKFHEKQEKG